MENIKEKPKKIGIKTLGIVLIIFGILFLIQVMFNIDILRYIVLAWPTLLIILGIEILVESKKSEIKISIVSFVIITFLIGFSFVIGIANTVINDILYSDKFLDEIASNNRIYYFDDDSEKITIFNYSENLVNLNVIENSDSESKIMVDIKYDIENNLASIIKLMNDEIYPINNTKNGIEILGTTDDIKVINLTVITNNKNKIETLGNVEILNK